MFTRFGQVHRYAPNAGSADSTFGDIALVSGAKPYGGFIVARSPGAGPALSGEIAMQNSCIGQIPIQFCILSCMAAALPGGAHLTSWHTGFERHIIVTALIKVWSGTALGVLFGA